MLELKERLSVIRHTLKVNGLSQAALAKKLDCNPAKLSLALSGTKGVPMVFLLEVLRESNHPIEKVFPEIKSELQEIVTLLDQGAQQEATINLLNLLKLTSYQDAQNETDTEAAS